jgi:putative endonuclease
MMAGTGQSPSVLFLPIILHCHPGESRDPLWQPKMFFVYLLASQPHGTLYVGVTSDLVQRVGQHKSKAVPGFTSTYRVDRLMWFEAHELWEPAIRREKQIKEWKRAWKIQLIEADNPHWADLYPHLTV